MENLNIHEKINFRSYYTFDTKGRNNIYQWAILFVCDINRNMLKIPFYLLYDQYGKKKMFKYKF